jgi:hypothetical protein
VPHLAVLLGVLLRHLNISLDRAEDGRRSLLSLLHTLATQEPKFGSDAEISY